MDEFTRELSEGKNVKRSFTRSDTQEIPERGYLKDYALGESHNQSMDSQNRARIRRMSEHLMSTSKKRNADTAGYMRNYNLTEKSSNYPQNDKDSGMDEQISMGLEEIKTKFCQILEFNKYLIKEVVKFKKQEHLQGKPDSQI